MTYTATGEGCTHILQYTHRRVNIMTSLYIDIDGLMQERRNSNALESIFYLNENS